MPSFVAPVPATHRPREDNDTTKLKSRSVNRTCTCTLCLSVGMTHAALPDHESRLGGLKRLVLKLVLFLARVEILAGCPRCDKRLRAKPGEVSGCPAQPWEWEGRRRRARGIAVLAWEKKREGWRIALLAC